jgi:hypothetical protein
MYPPGAVAAALGTIKRRRRLLTRAEINGSLPETVFGSFCVFASALLDATFPPPPPPDPRRSAPPSGAQAAPPAVRRAAYAYFAELAARAPGACGETDREDLSRDFGKNEHLRAFWQAPPLSVVEGAVRASLRAAVTFAACEVAAASGFAGAREAATRANGSFQTNASGAHEASLETSFENKDPVESLAGVPPTRFESVESSVDKTARSARATARGALRGLLGAHPNSGAYDEVLRRFKPSSVSANDAFFVRVTQRFLPHYDGESGRGRRRGARRPRREGFRRRRRRACVFARLRVGILGRRRARRETRVSAPHGRSV